MEDSTGFDNHECADNGCGGDGEVTKEDFFVAFRKEQASITEEINLVTVASAGASVHEVLDLLLERTHALEDSFTRITHVLIAYDAQQYQAAVRELRNCISRKREELAPRKKFQFKRGAQASEVRTTTAAADPDAENLDVGKPSPAMFSTAATPAVSGGKGELIEDCSRQVIVRQADFLAGRDMTLRRLTDCRVILLGVVGALHCHDLRRCEIYVGAISSSALLYNCNRCEITLATKQLRLHDSTSILFHLSTLSGPIIEHSRRIGFAPFDMVYPDSDTHLEAAALQKPSSGQWADVQDFNWHKRQASPNWCIVDAGLRRAAVTFSVPDLTSGSSINTTCIPPEFRALEQCELGWKETPVTRPSSQSTAGNRADKLDSDDEF